MNPPSHKLTLAHLSLPARLVIAAFLITVVLGYLAALLQLRVQHASAGQPLPTQEDVLHTFHGSTGQSQLERLLTAPMGQPFNGSGSMVPAFLDRKKSSGWEKAVKALAADKMLPKEEAEEQVRQQRDGERLAVLDWLARGASQKAFEDNSHPVSADLAARLRLGGDDPLLTEKFLEKNADGQPVVKIQSIFETRCVRCHGGTGSASEYPLETYEDIAIYLTPEKSGGMSLTKLTQSTHVHLLGFAVLWCLTGLLFACTSYPAVVRAVFGPWTLVAQVADIACWWLAWKYPVCAQAIIITGGLVGLGLAVQVAGTLFDLFRKGGKVVLVLVLAAVGAGVFVFYLQVVEPRLQAEQNVPASLSK
jgi:hypothetical protein